MARSKDLIQDSGRGRPIKCTLLVYLLVGLAAATAQDRISRAAQVRQEATIAYTGRYKIACPASLVQEALSRPALMGALWASYGYAPAYLIEALAEPEAVHVQDPTGISGDMWLVSAEDRQRLYLAEGQIDHWAVPAMNKGIAVFAVETTERDSLPHVTVQVYLEPDSQIAGIVLGMLSPVIKAHIANRVDLNFQDAARIMEAIFTSPKAVQKRLDEKLQREFERAFR